MRSFRSILEGKKCVYSSTFLRRTFTQFKNPFNVYFVCHSTKLGKKIETKQKPQNLESSKIKYSGAREKKNVQYFVSFLKVKGGFLTSTGITFSETLVPLDSTYKGQCR